MKKLFFTSIPKAGKNLIYSFINELGYQRDVQVREQVVRLAEQPWLDQAGASMSYALGPFAASAIFPQAISNYMEGINSGGDLPIVGHHHFPYSQEFTRFLNPSKIVAAFVYRDPRDVLLSMADYILNQHKPAHLAEQWGREDRDVLVEKIWQGQDGLLSLPEYYKCFAAWRDVPDVVEMRFESLVGERGGGAALLQRTSFQSLYSALGGEDDVEFDRALARAYNPDAGTYFKGRLNRWKEEGGKITQLLGCKEMASLVQEWGYPPN